MLLSIDYSHIRVSSSIDPMDVDEQNEEDLEYIPDLPDFIDGTPVSTDEALTDETHTGELPSEQDPRDTIEEDENGSEECVSFDLVMEIPEIVDMTDLIENSILAHRREALFNEWQRSRQEKAKRQSDNPILNALLNQKDKEGNYVYANEADAALSFNLFRDGYVVDLLESAGMNERDIETFAQIRDKQLQQAEMTAYKGQELGGYGIKQRPDYSWGQGTNVRYNVTGLSPEQQQGPKKKKGKPGLQPGFHSPGFEQWGQGQPAQQSKMTPQEQGESLYQQAMSQQQEELQKRQRGSSRKEAAKDPRRSKNPVLNSLLQQKDKNGKYRYADETAAALDYNAFADSGIQQVLLAYGLTGDEIKNYAQLRQHQLTEADKKVGGYGRSPKFGWGQETGVTFNVKGPGQGSRLQPQQKQQAQQQAQAQQWAQAQQQAQTKKAQKAQQRQMFLTWLGKNISDFYTRDQTKWIDTIDAYRYMTEPNYAWDYGLSEEERDAKWKRMQQVTAEFNQAYQAKGQQNATGAVSSRLAEQLTQQSDLIAGFLQMPRTASAIREASDLISAVYELDDGGTFDETTRSALRNASRNLLKATDVLRNKNSRAAYRVANRIERLYADSLAS